MKTIEQFLAERTEAAMARQRLLTECAFYGGIPPLENPCDRYFDGVAGFLREFGKPGTQDKEGR